MTSGYLPLGCYGKLPCYADFLSGRYFQPSSQAVREWLDAGRAEVVLETDEGRPTEPKETARRRFLYGLPGSAELMAGVIRPSGDQSGRRSFPFMVFTHFPRRQFGKHYFLVPIALSPIWEALDDAWDSLANVATKAAFHEVLESTLIPSPASLAEVRGSYQSLQGENAAGMFDHDGESLEELLHNLPGVIGQVKRGRENEAVRLELPVSGDRDAACLDAAFWIDLINRQLFLRRVEPAIFLPDAPAEKSNRVLMVFSILMPTDYALIMGCEGVPARAIRPAGEPRAAEQSGSPLEQILTYKELLARRFHASG